VGASQYVVVTKHFSICLLCRHTADRDIEGDEICKVVVLRRTQMMIIFASNLKSMRVDIFCILKIDWINIDSLSFHPEISRRWVQSLGSAYRKEASALLVAIKSGVGS
jgi:hypothetical protein